MCFFEENQSGSSRDPVGTQSGPSRDPVGTQSGTNFSIFGHRFWPVGIQSGSSRDPVGTQSGTNFNIFGHRFWPVKNSIFAVFLHVFGWFLLLPDRSKRGAKNSKIGARLDPDWIPTGSRLDPDGPKAVPKNAKIGARLGPDWIHRLARNHSRTYVSLPRPTLAPIFLFRAPAVHQYPPPSCTKTAKAVLSQTGVLQVPYINIYIYIYTYTYTLYIIKIFMEDLDHNSISLRCCSICTLQNQNLNGGLES